MLPPSSATDLFEALPVAVVVMTAGDDVLEVNDAATELLGLARDACIGKNLASCVVHANGRTRIRRDDGTDRVVTEQRRTLEDGRVVYVLHDVTATAAEADALRESAQQLEWVANTVPALLAFVDNEARYVWVNEAYRAWFGQAPESIRGRHVREVLGEAPWEQVRERIDRVVSGEVVVFDNRAFYKDGPPRDVHVAYVPHRDASGQVRGFAVLVTDVGDIKRVERALRDSEHEIRSARAQLQLVMDSTPASIARLGRDRRLVWANKTYASRFGKRPEELVGMHLQEIVGEETHAAMEPFCERVLAGETLEVDTEVPYPALGRRVVQLVAGPTRDASGTPDGCVVVITDVTHRRALELERERALHELKEADRQKDEFLAMLSHELRNPLAPIVCAVEILRLADPGDLELSAKYRAVIGRQVAIMKRLLDDLLDVARVSQGKIELRKALVDLGGVMARAVEVSRPLIGDNQQRLVVSTPGTVLVDADSTRLVQVFANLLNNAAKYTERGGRIEIDLTVTEHDAIVSVRDNGIGMTPELLERAFDLFVQETRSLDRAQGGLGIGLTMVRNLVRMHGGSVRAFSDGPGRGSEIVVRLPRAVGAAPTTSDHAPVPEPTGTSQPLRVLVVDDNVDVASTLGELLESMGHTVTLAPDGPTALSLVASANPELVLIDIGLPGMDGYAVAAALRSAGFDRAALVAITGYGGDADKRRSHEAGFDHHLVKPVDLETLQKLMYRSTELETL